tara:strand:+ start:669 stop:1262 length:594 start_codon:yes stop_codon:yes gene_type:complete
MVVFFSIVVILSIIIAGWIIAPKFLESHNYKVIKKEKNLELRKYDKIQIIEVYEEGIRQNSLRNGFRKLIKYISSENETKQKISMTIPVLQKKHKKEKNWVVQFVLPKKFNSIKAPNPNNNEIKIKTLNINYVVSIKFSGVVNETLLQRNTLLLKEWAQKLGFEITSKSIYAFYNDPLTPGIFRRNEILFQIKYLNK